MIYTIKDNKIVILDDSQFNPKHILECGQIFSYKIISNGEFIVFSGDKVAKILKNDSVWVIESENLDYFINFFDLNTDYNQIKTNLNDNNFLSKAINFGYGIRILKQDLLETVISFVISANNNIGRIRKSLFYIRERLGDKCGEYFTFPSLQKLKQCDENFFINAGLGYRSKQMVKLLTQIDEGLLNQKRNLDTKSLRQWLMSLSGIGGKVADCILLFGYARKDVFPVDTWIEKVYNEYFDDNKNREQIRNILVEKYKNLSGYAQQYLFYFKREKN